MITMDMNIKLIVSVIDMKIKEVLDLIGIDRVSGSDGFSVSFF